MQSHELVLREFFQSTQKAIIKSLIFSVPCQLISAQNLFRAYFICDDSDTPCANFVAPKCRKWQMLRFFLSNIIKLPATILSESTLLCRTVVNRKSYAFFSKFKLEALLLIYAGEKYFKARNFNGSISLHQGCVLFLQPV